MKFRKSYKAVSLYIKRSGFRQGGWESVSRAFMELVVDVSDSPEVENWGRGSVTDLGSQ